MVTLSVILVVTLVLMDLAIALIHDVATLKAAQWNRSIIASRRLERVREAGKVVSNFLSPVSGEERQNMVLCLLDGDMVSVGDLLLRYIKVDVDPEDLPSHLLSALRRADFEEMQANLVAEMYSVYRSY